MSQKSFEQPTSQIELQLQQTAQHFVYPATPDIAAAVTHRLPGRRTRFTGQVPRVVWAALLALLTLVGLLVVPQVRAAVVEFLQLGAVRIFLVEPTATALPAAPPPDSSEIRPTPLASLLDLAGETTLEAAQAQVNFPIRLPPELGPPNNVFLQDFEGPLVILVWPEADISLHQLGPGVFAGKVQPRIIQETTIGNQPALWTEGPYLLQLENGDYRLRRVIEGNTLIWTEGDVTYRLESNQPLTTVLQIAESME